VDGAETALRVTGGTVSDALEQAGVQVGKMDMTSTSQQSRLTPGMEITVDRVNTKTYKVNEKIPYTVRKTETNTLLQGRTIVTRPGEDGVKTFVYEDTLTNGVVTETALLGQSVTKEPVEEELLVGTAVPAAAGTANMGGTISAMAPPDWIEVNEQGRPLNYSRVLRGEGTAYSFTGQGTATGVPTAVGRVAVDPKIIPYGTMLYIVSDDGKYNYGYCVAADTGGAMLSGRVLVDLYFNTNPECMAFGRRQITVYVL